MRSAPRSRPSTGKTKTASTRRTSKSVRLRSEANTWGTMRSIGSSMSASYASRSVLLYETFVLGGDEASRSDGGRAVTLVNVAEGWTAGLRARAVVADHLELGVPAVRGTHGPHVPLRGQDVGEEAVGIPAG